MSRLPTFDHWHVVTCRQLRGLNNYYFDVAVTVVSQNASLEGSQIPAGDIVYTEDTLLAELDRDRSVVLTAMVLTDLQAPISHTTQRGLR